MRDPSIHIRKSNLTCLLKEHGLSQKDIESILTQARKISCDNRSVSITNDKLKKDLTRVLKSSKGDTNLLADIIYSVRIKLKHRGIKKLHETDRDWLQLKELTKLCNQFCEDFELDKRAGYIKYISLAFPKIQSMRAYVSKFINMYESICSQYEAVGKLKEDKNPEETQELHDLFISKVADRTGIFETYMNNDQKMLAFYNAGKLCRELGVDPSIFIEAQFESLEWCNGIPQPEALYGDKAKERLNKYLYQNQITVKPQASKDFWKGLKNRTA